MLQCDVNIDQSLSYVLRQTHNPPDLGRVEEDECKWVKHEKMTCPWSTSLTCLILNQDCACWGLGIVSHLAPELLEQIYIIIYISKNGFSNMISDALATLLPDNQISVVKFLVDKDGSEMNISRQSRVSIKWVVRHLVSKSRDSQSLYCIPLLLRSQPEFQSKYISLNPYLTALRFRDIWL